MSTDHQGNTGPGLPLLARLYTQGRYTRASVDTNHHGQPLTSLANAAEWRQIAILRWQTIEDLTRERDALIAALEAQQTAERVPLTDEQLRAMHHEDEFGLFCDFDEFEQIARAVEQAHRITATSGKGSNRD